MCTIIAGLSNFMGNPRIPLVLSKILLVVFGVNLSKLVSIGPVIKLSPPFLVLGPWQLSAWLLKNALC